MALRGLKVVELAGLAPAPFCGMVLSDFGAQVIRVDKVGNGPDVDRLARGKKSIAVNLKRPEGIDIVQQLCLKSDILIEPFRKGVMEKLGLGPKVMLNHNPKLIYARLSGFGQTGMYSERAGHDINYLAVSGILSQLSSKSGSNPFPPLNILGDFAGGGLACALGITLALFERTWSGRGQVIDASIVEGASYISSWLWSSRDLPIWSDKPGESMLGGGAHFYNTYKTKDNKYMAVGAIEPQFYSNLLKGLGFNEDDLPQMPSTQEAKQKMTAAFAEKTQSEWCSIFDKVDACVSPVLELNEAPNHPHNKQRGNFMQVGKEGGAVPRPAPILQNISKNVPNMISPSVGQHTREILLSLGIAQIEIEELLDAGVVGEAKARPKL